MEESVIIPTLAEENVEIPLYASDEAAGGDIRANIAENIVLEPGQRILIPSGIRLAIPKGFEIQIRPRSGLALKYGITVLNTPGTIDSDYRGEIKVLLINLGQEKFVIEPKMRIAQLVLQPVIRAHYLLEKELLATERGVNGFGHTGNG